MSKSVRISLFSLSLFLSTAIFFGIRKDFRNASKAERLEQDCKELTIGFGNKVRIKSGFYAGVEGTAVGKNNLAVDVQYLKGLELKTEGFECGSVEVIK